jgi:hypothetical protein
MWPRVADASRCNCHSAGTHFPHYTAVKSVAFGSSPTRSLRVPCIHRVHTECLNAGHTSMGLAPRLVLKPPRVAKPVTQPSSSLTKCNARARALRVQSISFEANSNTTETKGERRETLDADFDCRCAAGSCTGRLCDRTGAGLLRRRLLPPRPRVLQLISREVAHTLCAATWEARAVKPAAGRTVAWPERTGHATVACMASGRLARSSQRIS